MLEITFLITTLFLIFMIINLARLGAKQRAKIQELELALEYAKKHYFRLIEAFTRIKAEIDKKAEEQVEKLH